MSDFFKKIYAFFASKETPNSGFYLTLLSAIGTIGVGLANSNDPRLITIGGVIVAVYAASNAFAEAIGQKKVITPQVNVMPVAPAGVQVTANQTPFGTPKVGPDTVADATPNG